MVERRRLTAARNLPSWGKPDDRRSASWAEGKREHRTGDHWNRARSAVDCFSVPYPSWLRDMGRREATPIRGMSQSRGRPSACQKALPGTLYTVRRWHRA